LTSPQYDAIDEKVAAEIKRLHKRHPQLGHHGLLEALEQVDVHVDPEQLERFMADHRIKAERSWRPWKWTGLPRWWFGGIIHPRTTRRWRLWRK
jgi:hypothetical protein